MTKEMITRILSGVGIAPNVPARIPELRAINLRSNGNHVIDARTDEVTFDNENSVVEIKEYEIIPVNGIFLHPEIHSDKIEYFAPKTTILKKFRKPQVKDIVVSVDNTSGEYKILGNITELTYEYFKLDKPVTDLVNVTLLYCDPDNFGNAIRDIYDNRCFYLSKPATKFPVDIYIDYSAIVSISAVNSQQNYF